MLILVVDDSEMSRSVLEKVLHISGYETVGAEDGDQALKIAQERKPDLIISDIMMPAADGYEFCRNLRMDPDLRDTPFIFYSAAFTSPQDVDFGYDLGATHFIQKPQNSRQILKIIEDILSAPKELREPASDSLQEPSFLKAHSKRVVQKLEEKSTELEHTHAFLETVLNSMAEGLLVIGRDYTVIDANYAACTLLKVSKEDLVGKACHDVFHGLQKPCGLATAMCPFGDVFDRGEATETTYTHTISCEGHVLEVMASPVRNADGRITSMVEILRDVTERMKLEEEINARIQELEEFYDASVGKEIRLIELEKEVRRLRALAGEPEGEKNDP